ncbi:MAG: M23 family metallopeptidase [candidate division WOR-3 bacterium]
MKGEKVRYIINIYNLKNSKSVVLKLTKASFGIALGLLFAFISSILAGIILTLKFTFVYVENLALKRQNQKLRSYISKMEEEVNFIKSSLDSIFKITNSVRIIAGLTPLSNDIRYLGIGGYIQKREDNLSFEVDNIKRMLNFEMRDVENISRIIKEKREDLERMPSIIPAPGIIISNFGYRNDPFTGEYKMHEGIDIAAPIGTPVYASANGVVIFSGYKEGYGLCVEISHKNGIITRYAHLSRSLVRVGQEVKRGEIIGKVGSTGRSTGSHLHYEVIVNGIARNPMNYIILSDVIYD